MSSSLSALTPAVHSALCACFSLPPDSEQALSFIRPAFADPEPSPRPDRHTDVLYWSLTPVPGDPPAHLDWSPAAGSSALRPRVTRFLSLSLLLVFYGPSAPDHAARVRSFLFLDGEGRPRRILRSAGLYPVPDPPAPTLLHEPEGSLWRARADLTLSLRFLQSLDPPDPQPALSSAPAILLHPAP